MEEVEEQRLLTWQLLFLCLFVVWGRSIGRASFVPRAGQCPYVRSSYYFV